MPSSGRTYRYSRFAYAVMNKPPPHRAGRTDDNVVRDPVLANPLNLHGSKSQKSLWCRCKKSRKTGTCDVKLKCGTRYRPQAIGNFRSNDAAFRCAYAILSQPAAAVITHRRGIMCDPGDESPVALIHPVEIRNRGGPMCPGKCLTRVHVIRPQFFSA